MIVLTYGLVFLVIFKLPGSSSAMNPLYQRSDGHEGISRLLWHFYADVRQDPMIGPTFYALTKD